MSGAPAPPPNARASNTLRLRNHPRGDPTRALEPARKKLTTIESQRIMAVFEESIKRAEIVTALPYITENIDRFKVSLGTELVDVIKQHGRIQVTYRDIRAQLDELLQKRERQLAKNASRASTKLQDGDDGIDDGFDDDEGEEQDEETMDKKDVEDSDIAKENVADNIEQMMGSRPQSVQSDLDPRIEEVMRNLGLVAQQVGSDDY